MGFHGTELCGLARWGEEESGNSGDVAGRGGVTVGRVGEEESSDYRCGEAGRAAWQCGEAGRAAWQCGEQQCCDGGVRATRRWSDDWEV